MKLLAAVVVPALLFVPLATVGLFFIGLHLWQRQRA